MTAPRAFASYSWDDESHKSWVAALATDLRQDGIETILDQWHAVPGDQLPAFMEQEILKNDYVLIICTPNYRLKSDKRLGGVGYEGDIMTAEVLTTGNDRKFIPVLARGTWEKSGPAWLKGKYYVDLSTRERYRENYPDLTSTMLDTRATAPPLRKRSRPLRTKTIEEAAPQDPIRIMGVIVDQVTEPRLDGTRGSDLYTVPVRLNRKPSTLWIEFFIRAWNRRRRFTLVHRPGIPWVKGAVIGLDCTTLEEVRKYHRVTLVRCVQEANRKESKILPEQTRVNEVRRQRSEEHRTNVEAHARDISFD